MGFGYMILEQQLFRNYNELYELILCCYKDISILKAYEKLQKEKSDLYNMTSHVSNHFIVLVQKDLALTLWKICYDNSPNANTVPKFRNAIYKLLKDCDNKFKPIKNKKTNGNIENKLRMMRKQFLAHADMKRDSSRIEICELKELLDSICNEFNRVCDVIDDDRIVNVSEINIGLQDMTCYPELLVLYSQK